MSAPQIPPGTSRAFLARVVLQLARGRPAGLGAYMFVFHRLTALGLVIYLYIHLVTLGTVLRGAESFDRAMATLDTPVVRLLELGLVWLVLFHALNGLRLSLLALRPGLDQRWLSYGVVAASMLVALLSLPLFLR